MSAPERVNDAKQHRLMVANAMLVVIAYHGRRFFLHNGRVSRLELDERGRVWFIDAHTRKRIYTHANGRWRGFTEGGTLRSLIQELSSYVTHGLKLSRGKFGPWAQWICEGDLWGYGEDMQMVHQVAYALELVDEPQGKNEARHLGAAPGPREGR